MHPMLTWTMAGRWMDLVAAFCAMLLVVWLIDRLGGGAAPARRKSWPWR